MDGVRFIGDINNGDGVFIGVKADFFALVFSIGTIVDDTLGIVGVAIGTVTTGKAGAGGVLDIDHVQPTTTGVAVARPNQVSKATVFVDNDVVR